MPKTQKSEFAHESTYKFRGCSGIIHRNRLKNIFRAFNSIDIQPEGCLADFGCSNGYIISLLKERKFRGKKWSFFGFDHDESLLAQAKAKDMQDCEFNYVNLNKVDCNNWSKQNYFDIVTCFETLEHVGSYKNAFANIYNSCKIGGKIIICFPNERGFQGITKYFGRKLVRKFPYESFFKSQSEFPYILNLVFNRDIEKFRIPERYGWQVHLGFDWKKFEYFLRENYLFNKKCEVINRSFSLGKFNIIYILKKTCKN